MCHLNVFDLCSPGESFSSLVPGVSRSRVWGRRRQVFEPLGFSIRSQSPCWIDERHGGDFLGVFFLMKGQREGLKCDPDAIIIYIYLGGIFKKNGFSITSSWQIGFCEHMRA